MPRDLIIETPVPPRRSGLDPALDILRTGRERVAKAWIQRRPVAQFRNLYDTEWAYCMLGAIFEQSKARQDAMWEAEQTLTQAVNLLVRRPNTISIVYFNDDWQRWHADVVEAYDVAIELRERGQC